MDRNTTPLTRQEFEELLPWFVAGTLDRDDIERVEAFLTAHPELSSQLKLAEDERFETIAVNEAIGAPSAGAFDRLMESIGESEPRPFADFGARVSAWFGEFWDGLAQPAMRLAAVTAGVLIVAQFMALVFLMQGDDGSRYRTASGDVQSDVRDGSFVIVQFAEDVPMASITKLLTSQGFAIVSGPKPGGIYTVRIAAKKLSDDEVAKRVDQLLADDKLVTFAAPGAQPGQ